MPFKLHEPTFSMFIGYDFLNQIMIYLAGISWRNDRGVCNNFTYNQDEP